MSQEESLGGSIKLETNYGTATIRPDGMTSIDTGLCEVLVKVREDVDVEILDEWADLSPEERTELALESAQEAISETLRGYTEDT